MGCYDTISGRCPRCDARVEFQSKGGRCQMKTYDIHNVPTDVAGGTGDVYCPKCGTSLYVRTVTTCSVEEV